MKQWVSFADNIPARHDGESVSDARVEGWWAIAIKEGVCTVAFTSKLKLYLKG